MLTARLPVLVQVRFGRTSSVRGCSRLDAEGLLLGDFMGVLSRALLP
jgi:hypothetical protein